ncbi:ABC transporter ATP-binding protein [Radiobacillus kanasensis]|uniref:ABC transporter ATP-binding protein n=1 Tax=Radiobacillus kanasensis TaxID=2844358 RepID=UPI001E31E3BC|nr:ABC transporter ATP-binding protein [Radiobacillus kanasensis]UFU00111.1 ABC transporter ATP-binding protein [Radiobacillus kanasensis]
MTTIVKNLVKQFGKFEALKGIHLEIEDGEFIAILGPSGCGKTTLLRLLAGFDSPTDGSIQISGSEVGNPKSTLPPEKRNIGMVFQSFALWPHLNVKEHIRFPLVHHRFVPKGINIEERIQDVLDITELNAFAGRMPNELSGGQKQRVALGRAIAPQPDLLLMDEPLSNLDAELRMEMRKEIQEIHRLTKATIIYVTHDQSEALAMADRIVVMNQGKIEQVGTPREIYSFPSTEFVASFVGKANLIRGTWYENHFEPELAPQLKWQDHGVSDDLKKKSLYPLRPEQIELSHDEGGIPGVITSVQYQGKEIHYTVQTQQQNWVVHMDLWQAFPLGDSVFVRMKQEQIPMGVHPEKTASF